ncbi:aminotransferase class III-fold pyridoxal phosphate-dependent enzyme [Tatumella ptyseos]|uniref:4-aminobutyrate aminotransferase GabT n=1 Tax=Tatumella ptyseos TaxID=82987 RepID=A0A2X5R8G8_9GAMM|nr:aminotransferase class III-fold pyridoxal phosphate-dependent enzyme [Tatumella ptyseos]SQK74865.1 4-aminobutyrate aminotransferase GabT [Tatumella ptyseos]
MSEVMTAFPASNDHWLDARNREIPAGLVTVHPLVIGKGRGAEVWDVEGTRYLDFAGGSGGLNIGHNHPAVVSAITRQLNQFTGDCFRVAASPLYIRLACRLNQLVGGDEAFQTVFFNTGADAVAQAVNSARAFTGRPGIITFEGAFHHSSLADCRLTGHSPVGQADSAHGASDVCSLPYPDSSRGFLKQTAGRPCGTVWQAESVRGRSLPFFWSPFRVRVGSSRLRLHLCSICSGFAGSTICY